MRAVLHAPQAGQERLNIQRSSCASGERKQKPPPKRQGPSPLRGQWWSGLSGFRICPRLAAIGRRSKFQDTVYQQLAFLVSSLTLLIGAMTFLVSPLTFLIGATAFLVSPPFCGFSSQSFSAQHDVERDSSSPTGDSSVGKHLVYQVQAETPLQVVPIAPGRPD